MAPARIQLLAIPLAVCGLALMIVGLLGDSDLLIQVITAMGICLAPSFVQLFHRRRVQTGQDRLVVLVRSMIWRMGLTLAASLALGVAFPEQFRAAFWIALLASYQVVLATETWAMYREQSEDKKPETRFIASPSLPSAKR